MAAFHGLTVTVYRPRDTVDSHGNRVGYTTETVADVLCMPGATAEAQEAVKPYGAIAVATLGFPKDYQLGLAGCLIEVPGWPGRFEVIGDPLPVLHDCPTRWNRKVYVRREDG